MDFTRTRSRTWFLQSHLSRIDNLCRRRLASSRLFVMRYLNARALERVYHRSFIRMNLTEPLVSSIQGIASCKSLSCRSFPSDRNLSDRFYIYMIGRLGRDERGVAEVRYLRFTSVELPSTTSDNVSQALASYYHAKSQYLLARFFACINSLNACVTMTKQT